MRAKCFQGRQSPYVRKMTEATTNAVEEGANDQSEEGVAAGGLQAEAVTDSHNQVVHDFMKDGRCIIRVNSTMNCIVCGFCSKATTQKQAWRHLRRHGVRTSLRQEVLSFVAEGLEEFQEQDHQGGRVHGLPTVEGVLCDACNHGYRNMKSFKVHTRRGCPGNAVPSTLQPQLVGRQRRLVPVEIVDTPATECFDHIQSVSVQAIMALVQEGINGNAPVSADLSIKDAFHAEMKWDTFLVVDGSFDAAMQLKTPKSVALMTACKDWLRGVVNLMWQYDHMLKRALMKVRLVCREIKHNSSFC